MSHVLQFSVSGARELYQLPVGDTLCGFIGYDFSVFSQRCAALTQHAREIGYFDDQESRSLQESIRCCHPYYNALIDRDFNDLVTDCAIDRICQTDNMGSEELWARCISAKTPYSRRIFERISEYKTDNAINQWVNLLRMQEYATAKAGFVFETQTATVAESTARKRYYDLVFSMTAEQMRLNPDELPSTRIYSASLLPNASQQFDRAARLVLPLLPEMTQEVSANLPVRRAERLPDQAAELVLHEMPPLSRPTPQKISRMMEIFEPLSDEIYQPNGLKAMLDLEFDRMLEWNLVLRRDGHGDFFVCDLTPAPPPLPTPRSESETIPPPAPPEPPEPSPAAEPIEPPLPYVRTEVSPEDEDREDCLENLNRPLVSEDATPALYADRNVSVYCQLVRTALFVQVDKEVIAEEEFEHWDRHLISLRRNVLQKITAESELERFLDQTVALYELKIED